MMTARHYIKILLGIIFSNCKKEFTNNGTIRTAECLCPITAALGDARTDDYGFVRYRNFDYLNAGRKLFKDQRINTSARCSLVEEAIRRVVDAADDTRDVSYMPDTPGYNNTQTTACHKAIRRLLIERLVTTD